MAAASAGAGDVVLAEGDAMVSNFTVVLAADATVVACVLVLATAVTGVLVAAPLGATGSAGWRGNAG